ncbi:unnamed protein product [Mortierella alpina]
MQRLFSAPSLYCLGAEIANEQHANSHFVHPQRHLSNNSTSEDLSVSFTGWASTETVELKQWNYHPRPLGHKDTEIEITHCGICGSDVHTVTGGWGPLQYGPCIPGHEIIGKVVAKGTQNKLEVGDVVGVGAMCDACGNCDQCDQGRDQLCSKRAYTYNDIYRDERGGKTYGGYADRVRANGQRFGAGPGKRVGVIGIGGLERLAIQWARASDNKREVAKKLGATKFVKYELESVRVKKDEELQSLNKYLDITVCTSDDKNQDWGKLLSLVRPRGTVVIIALPEAPLPIPAFELLSNEVSLAGSAIGTDKNVRPWIERMSMSDPNAAVKHLMEGRPCYRIVMER